MTSEPGGSDDQRSAGPQDSPDPRDTRDPRDTVAMVEEHEQEAADDDAHVGLVGGPEHLGTPGPPLDRRSPFYLGFFGGLGALTAWWLGTTILAIGSTLLLIVVSLFLAAGLHPAVLFLERRGLRGIENLNDEKCANSNKWYW